MTLLVLQKDHPVLFVYQTLFKILTYVNPFPYHHNPEGREGDRLFYYPHFADEDIEVQRGYVTYLRSHSPEVVVGTLTLVLQMILNYLTKTQKG